MPAPLRAQTSIVEAMPTVTTEYIENRCPQLASLRIEATSNDLMKIDIMVDIEFGEHTSGIFGGTIRLSLRQATLELRLSGCELPLKDRRFTSPLAQTIDVTQQITKTNADVLGEQVEEAFEASASLVKASVKSVYGEKHTSKEEINAGMTEGCSFTRFLIETFGGPELPTWKFSPKGVDSLVGSYPERELGTITAKKTPAVIDALIRVAPDDINTQCVGGIWPREMTPRKTQMTRLFALYLMRIKKRLSNNYVSRMQFVYC